MKIDYNELSSQPCHETHVLPCGTKVLTRETNGDDESVLSAVKTSTDGTNIRQFLSRVIVCLNHPGENDWVKASPSVVGNMKSRSVNYLLLCVRIQSLGSEMAYDKEFQLEENKNTQTVQLEVDLNQYTWDFSKPFEEFPANEGDKGYFKYRCKPYEHGAEEFMNIELDSGVSVRYKYLTNKLEYNSLVELKSGNNNTLLLIREIEYRKGNNKPWQRVENFGLFTSREMKKIRKPLLSDGEFGILTEFTNPLNNITEVYPLVGEPDFFFPVED